MSHLRRIAVLLLISLTAAYGLAVAPARAAGAEAIKAADYIVSTFEATGDKRFGDVGGEFDLDPENLAVAPFHDEVDLMVAVAGPHMPDVRPRGLCGDADGEGCQ